MPDKLPFAKAYLWATAHYAFAIPEAAFVAACAAKFPEGQEISESGATEVYLAVACSEGDAGAIAAFEREYMDLGRIRAAVSHLKLSPDAVDELAQGVRQKLLIPKDGEPIKLLGYAGDGTLPALIKVMVVRAGLSMVRGRKAQAPADELEALPSANNDPELSFLKRQYRGEFREAFAEAAAGLDKKQRNLLRLHLLHGVTLQALADSYSVHRATVVRWLADARASLLRGTQAAMRKRLGATSSEVASVMALIESHLDASVHRLLESD